MSNPPDHLQHVSVPDAAMAAGETLSLRLDPAAREAVEAFAASNAISREVALCRLVKLGLTIAPTAQPAKTVRTARAIELAASQIDQLIDPAAPLEERDRLISRLTKGPPEFVEARRDLPKLDR